ncbi:uncharacterized protein LOC114535538 [Dendronephthya gigantea]|uniref:uncharacterized protein LOC114535538 n=1 Tax=Dendronephthya gigantea TaxID=151771 RepID=UPI00106D7CCE|nr:uncharacterized protein LOC114535538 [Dendronephthya gigantea]
MIFMFSPLAGSLIDLFGMRKVSFAGGFLYSVGLISASYVNSIYGFSLFLGPPLAGFLRDATGTFKLPLIIAGCLEIVGALISFPVARVKIGHEPGQDNHENSENNNNI